MPGFGTISLEELRLRMEAFVAERAWSRFHTPRNLLLALVGEVCDLPRGRRCSTRCCRPDAACRLLL